MLCGLLSNQEKRMILYNHDNKFTGATSAIDTKAKATEWLRD